MSSVGNYPGKKVVKLAENSDAESKQWQVSLWRSIIAVVAISVIFELDCGLGEKQFTSGQL